MQETGTLSPSRCPKCSFGETRGYKMLDVTDNQCVESLKIFSPVNVYSEKSGRKCRLLPLFAAL